MDSTTLKDMLIRHEELRLRPYLDCCGKFWRDCVCAKKGKLTLGVGRNIDDVGITKAEAMTLLDNDIIAVYSQALKGLPWFQPLSLSRQNVILDMIFNMGLTDFLEFKHMIAAIQEEDFGLAKQEMLSSKWATQVGSRAVELADMMERG